MKSTKTENISALYTVHLMRFIQEFPGNTPPRVDRDLKPRRPSTDCPTPSPSRSPVGHIASGSGTRSGQGSIDSMTDIEYNNLLQVTTLYIYSIFLSFFSFETGNGNIYSSLGAKTTLTGG